MKPILKAGTLLLFCAAFFNEVRDGKISLSLFEGYSYIVAVETDPWGDKVECGMTKVDISSQPANPLRIVIDRKGRCDEKAFAKELDAGIKK